ncbi:MAG: efflux RND transporter permease subunit, partial [Planctomycetes bacterium]|nr:efflux RND transporter permease subunit [Planctomycetota bacterium]
MIKYFASHATAGNLLMLAFLALGLSALSGIKRESMPDFTTETLQITANYPGATAEEVEEAIAAPIEEALEGVNGIKNINTSAMEGSVSIRVEMEEGADWQTFYNDVKTEVEGISSFPGEFEKLTIKPYNRTDQVFSLAVYGDMSPLHLKEYCDRLKDRLVGSAAGITVEVNGFSQREFRIEMHPEALRAYNLTVNEIAEIVANQNADLPSGTLQTGEQDIVLRFSDRRKTVEDLAGIRIIASASGNELTLGDIATITDRFKQDESKVLFNGRRAGIISVAKSKSADSLTVFDRATAVLEREMAAAPAGVEFAITRNRASDIQDRLNMLYLNAAEGFVLVFVALWVFLNIKLSFWVAMGLPISFLGGLFFMNWFGISLNMISTFALLIALGLLMD